jgi:hypothetical protein
VIGALVQTESCRALAKRLPHWIELARHHREPVTLMLIALVRRDREQRRLLAIQADGQRTV